MLRYPTAFCRGAVKILLSSVRTAETILPTTVYMRECSCSLTGKNALRKEGFPVTSILPEMTDLSNAALKKTFGLWIYNTDRNGDVRCLCPKCLSDYIHDPNYVVRRLDPFAKSKDHCDKCNNSGWDYIVYDKRTSVKGKGCRNVK